MLDNETKRRIDTARDILVGKVPDPKSQVEQITIALIYKFMDDMDKEAVDFGGESTFFAGEYEKYSWTKIFDTKIGGHEMLNLYGEAIVKLNINPNIPQLFRDIFKNAYLPYRDPETLKMFLKTINEFRYDHSEMLGDAFEYLLSVLGSQGDAGQFRTPRHIIDFMVQILNPQKGESICDPACGTAGFLISSFKQIVEQNTNKSKGDLLTPDDRKRMMQNFVGYDISPDMVRLSLVNLYLHGFTAPRIYEYDTLTSEERWNEYYDIVLANPPFMTPKGGIKPHKKFTVQAKKSEVLFTDYIVEHMNPSTGRAAIIVPNGIVATTQTAYKQLRKLMVNESLIAVISLPAGVFQPYSAVKTSILILDKRLAKKSKHILFLKVDNDGFGLGAQRRAIEENDLTLALETITIYKLRTENNESIGKLQNFATLVEKQTILNNKNIDLSAERYIISEKITNSKFDIVNLIDYCDFKRGTSITLKDVREGTIPVIAGGQQPAYFHDTANRTENTITISSSGAYAGFVNFHTQPIFASDCFTISPKNQFELNIIYLFQILKGRQKQIYSNQEGGGQPHVYPKHFDLWKIPLPSLLIQQQIVNEIESYQKIIDGAKQVVNNYNPTIGIRPNWKLVALGEVASFKNGLNYTRNDKGNLIKIIGVGDFKNYLYPFIDTLGNVVINEKISTDLLLQKDDLLFVRSNGNKALVGRCIIIPTLSEEVSFSGFSIRLRFNDSSCLPIFYCHLFRTDFFRKILAGNEGANISNISQERLREIQIPLPTIEEQTSIVQRIDEEQSLVNSNKRLIELFEQKIKDKINEVWGVKEEKKYKVPQAECLMVAEDDI